MKTTTPRFYVVVNPSHGPSLFWTGRRLVTEFPDAIKWRTRKQAYEGLLSARKYHPDYAGTLEVSDELTSFAEVQ